MKKNLKEILGKQILFFDGGTGTVLQEWGLKPGEFSENWNLSHPEKIQQLHYEYYKAGANIIKTNTFGALSIKFPLNLEKIITSAIQNANNARNQIQKENQTSDKNEYFIAYDISSTGKLLKPLGDLDFEDAVNIFKKSFNIALKQKIDCILIETMNDGYETKAAVLAAKESLQENKIDLPIFVTNVYDSDARLLSGATPESMVAMLEGLGVDAIGINCSLGPEQMLPVVSKLSKVSSLPIIVNPNAGLPRVQNGKTVFDVEPTEFVQTMEQIVDLGACVIGGCCGTNPTYIKELTQKLSNAKIQPITQKNLSVISSGTKTVYFQKDKPTVLIGERINPTGKKKFKEALRNNDISYIINQGLEQEKAGAQVLDVNVGLPEIDEQKMMLQVMQELQSVTELPLQIDTTEPQVMEAALRRYNGKAMINSVNGKQEVMDAIFPLVKKYGGFVVALTLDENGIPETSEGRIKIAEKIYAEAKKYGLQTKDIIIDPLAMAVSSDSSAAKATLQTVQQITTKYNGTTSLGISNISFGLPEREIVTSTFFTMAMQNGLTAAIMNPLSPETKKAYYTYNLLQGYDDQCLQYIDFAQNYAQTKMQQQTSAAQTTQTTTPNAQTQTSESKAEQTTSALTNAIIHGLKTDSEKYTQELLKTTDSLTIINEHLIPGLDYVGKCFENKTMFLPQLLMAAEAAKNAFSQIRAHIEQTGQKGTSRGTIILATVKGDIHDIGKNIVKVLLQNYDFDVIDLGKDVPPETVVETCLQNNVKLVGLSALMTTTVAAMEETIKLLRQKSPQTKICVGGAVLTQEYADMIGADAYCKDAMETVKYATKLFA